MFGLLPRGTAYILVLAALIYTGVTYIPIYFNALQFHDAIRQEVRFAGTGRRTVDSVRASIFQMAEEYSAPVAEDGVEVSAQGPFFRVRVRYAVPVDLRVYQHAVAFDWELSGETFAE